MDTREGEWGLCLGITGQGFQKKIISEERMDIIYFVLVGTHGNLFWVTSPLTGPVLGRTSWSPGKVRWSSASLGTDYCSVHYNSFGHKFPRFFLWIPGLIWVASRYSFSSRMGPRSTGTTPTLAPPGSVFYWHPNVLAILHLIEILFLTDSLFLISLLLCNTLFCWPHFWFSPSYNCCYFQHLFSLVTSINEVQKWRHPSKCAYLAPNREIYFLFGGYSSYSIKPHVS